MNFNREYLSQLSNEELIELLMVENDTQEPESPEDKFFDLYTREIIDLSPDAVLILDPQDMHLLACNQVALRLLQLDSENHLETYLANLFSRRPLFYDLLIEISSKFSQEPDFSMEIEFDTYEKQKRYGDLVVRNVEVFGRQILMLRIMDLTEIKLAQVQALDSERQLEMAQEIALMGSYIYYQETQKFQFSNAFYQLLDLTSDDSKPQSLEDLMKFIIEEDHHLINNAVSDIYSKLEDISVEFRIISIKGSIKYLYAKLKIEKDSFGKIDKLVGTVQDITERVQIQERLWESEHRYRLIVENTNDGVWYWNFRTLEGYMSPKFEQTLGFEGQMIDTESIGKWFKKVHPEERQAYRQIYDDCIQGLTESFNIEFRYLNREGNYFWVESRASLIRDDQNKPLYLLGTLREIQDRKEAEFKLKEHERFLEMAQRVAHLGSWIWDRKTDSLEYSDELYHIMEFDKNIHNLQLGDEVIKSVPDEDKVMVDRFLSESLNLKDGEQHFMETRFIVPSGKVKVLRTTGRVYQRNAVGEVIKLIGTTQDITADKAREEELREAKIQAEISQQAKDRFLQIVSHEIRNPLNAIVGISRLLEESEPSKTDPEQLAALGFSSRHLLAIINDVLDTAKLQYGNIKLDRVPFNLKEHLSQIEELFKPMAADRETQLQFEVDSRIPGLIIGDPTRFNQIIFNLLSNAVKYTFRGLISLSARLLKLNKQTALLEFKVSDNGIGIPVEKLDKVFEAFEHFDLPESQQKGGTGLGLYIVREMVNLMKGTIEVQSEFGEGAVFTFQLAFDCAEEEMQRSGQINKRQQADLSDCRILYVEDANYNQLLLKGYAQVWNLQIDLASDVKEALRLAESRHYDLILTDYRLPDGTGGDVAIGLEHLKIRQKTPLIVISAYQLDGSEEQALFDDYLQKPINFDKFFYILRQYLRQDIGPHLNTIKNSSKASSNVLKYLEENQPGQYFRIIENLEKELPEFEENLIRSIQTQNYKLYLHTVHKLSSALKMTGEEKLLDYLQNIHDLPETAEGKKQSLAKIKSAFEEVVEKCKAIQLSSKTT